MVRPGGDCYCEHSPYTALYGLERTLDIVVQQYHKELETKKWLANRSAQRITLLHGRIAQFGYYFFSY